jgi:tetratricopeptide (TPR) repeat protein
MMSRVAAVFLLSAAPSALFAFQEELRFVEALTEEGFSGPAQIVLERTLSRFPEARSNAPSLNVRILISEKKFAEAQTQIAAMSNSPALYLFLADTAYRARQFPAAEAAYGHYFKTAASAGDEALQAAFNFGELLEQRGESARAKKVYEQVLKFPNPGRSARPVKIKLAKRLMEEDPARAKKLCEEVQLGGLDLWFGQAVVIWADIMIRRNEWSEAQSTLETQLEILKGINDALEKQGQPVSQISPFAGARYLLGVCYEHADKKAEALHQFYNVYVQFGDSEWGPSAQKRAEELKSYFEGQGKTVKIELGANRSKMEESAFRVARRYFFDKQYAAAVPAHLDALNKFPEGDEAVTALRELMLSYISLGDLLSAKTVAAYTGERFASREEAAEALLAAGKHALDEKRPALAGWIYDCYFRSFPQNARAPAVLYSLAEFESGTEQAACWNRILASYPDSSYAVRSLGRLAWSAYEKGDYKIAAELFEKILLAEDDVQKLTRARFALAESYRSSSDWKKALENFQTLETSLTQATESFGTPDELRAFSGPFVEKSIFYQGVCLAKLGETERAVQRFDCFIATFRTSEFIPQALLAKGSALMDLSRYDEALASFSSFNESSDRRLLEPALYYRGQAYFETGRYTEAVQCLETLLNNWPESAFFFEAKWVQGRAYAANRQNSEAVRVLGDILRFASDDLLLNRAGLELGRAQTDPSEKLASFQRVALLADPGRPELAPLVAAALFESLPLYLELSRPQDLLTDADRLLEKFPMFGKTEEIKTLCAESRERLAKTKYITADNAD